MNFLEIIIGGLIGWLIGKFGDEAISSVKKKLTSDNLQFETEVLPDNYFSDFVDTSFDFERVINIRRSFFKKSLVSSDDNYAELYKKNKFGFRLVFENKTPIGYWSILPIDIETYEAFVKGESSHAKVLDKSLEWNNLPETFYLYITGIVVENHNNRDNSKSFSKQRNAACILDLLGFIHFLISNKNLAPHIKGICGYPSRLEGDRLFRKGNLMEWNGILQDGQRSQKIYVGSDLIFPKMIRYINIIMERQKHLLPEWKNKFQFMKILENINGRKDTT